MSIGAIEFDRTKFDSPVVCEQWMNTNSHTHTEFKQLLDSKKFRLKATTAKFISDEPRKVWGWYSLWDAKALRMDRPSIEVVMVRKIGSAGYWDHAEVPNPLPATQEKRQKLDFQRQKREVKRRDNAEKLKRKREEKTGVKKPKSIKRLKVPWEGTPERGSGKKHKRQKGGLKESDLITPLTPLGRSDESSAKDALESLSVPSINAATHELNENNNLFLDESIP